MYHKVGQWFDMLYEKALSKKQQRFFGIVRATQKGTFKGETTPQVQRAAASMKKKDVKKFASTKHKGLPEKKINKEEKSADMNEAKYERGASTYGKASIRNKRMFGKGGNAAPPEERGAAIKVRRARHQERRYVKKGNKYHEPGKHRPEVHGVNKPEEERKGKNVKEGMKYGLYKGDGKVKFKLNKPEKKKEKNVKENAIIDKIKNDFNIIKKTKNVVDKYNQKLQQNNDAINKILPGTASMKNEGSLHKWFKGSKSKDGKPGWVNVVTGGTCASDKPGEGTPKCVSSSKRASMSKSERLSASRRKKKADPGQQSKSGAAKPTYVSTDKKKSMKEGITFAQFQEACWKGYEKKGMKTMFGKRYPNCVKKTKKEEVQLEGKEEGGYISNAAKAEVRNQRRFGKKGSAEPTGRFGQGTSEKAKLAVKRGEEHRARRGVKTKKEEVELEAFSANPAQQAAIAVAKKNRKQDLKIAKKKKEMKEESCGKGMYYCTDDKKCKPIPKGYKEGKDGMLVKEDMKGMSQKSGDKRSTESGAGMTAKGVAKYNRRTGGNLKTAVTTPPSKLKAGSKAAKRRKSFCARSKSWTGPRGKAARRRWNC